MTLVNLYSISKDRMIESGLCSHSQITNLDQARLMVVKWLSGNYSEVRYRTDIEVFENKSEINVIFESDVIINREYFLNELIKSINNENKF